MPEMTMKKIVVFFLSMALSSFALADMSCMNLSAGGMDPNSKTGQKITDDTKSNQDPAADLYGCFMEVSQGGMGASEVKGNCGCKQSVQKLCKFNTKKHKIKASGGADKAWCAVFAPWAL
ncbi:hypothetical protein ACYPKM_03230 [Pseudomonas aeruginosa]